MEIAENKIGFSKFSRFKTYREVLHSAATDSLTAREHSKVFQKSHPKYGSFPDLPLI